MDYPATGETLQLGSDEELAWRLSLLAPTETSRGVFFNSVLEVVQHLGNEDAVRRCLEVCGESRFLDFFNYPFSTYIKAIYTAARLLSERYGGFEGAVWQMGYQAARSFYASPTGRVVLLMAHGDPRRLLNTLPTASRTTSSTVEGTVWLTGPNSGVLRFKNDYMPRPYNAGALLATFEAAKVKGVKVEARPMGPLDTEYEISWS
jgi:uncharacterized protein (TIGR02265 family)